MIACSYESFAKSIFCIPTLEEIAREPHFGDGVPAQREVYFHAAATGNAVAMCDVCVSGFALQKLRVPIGFLVLENAIHIFMREVHFLVA